MTQDLRFCSGHRASYADPIRVDVGQSVLLTEREETWDGHRWIWAEADGRSGWVPDDLVIGDGTAGRAYSAVELEVAPETVLNVIHESHGWAWCCDADGLCGWVPLRTLSKERA